MRRKLVDAIGTLEGYNGTAVLVDGELQYTLAIVDYDETTAEVVELFTEHSAWGLSYECTGRKRKVAISDLLASLLLDIEPIEEREILAEKYCC